MNESRLEKLEENDIIRIWHYIEEDILGDHFHSSENQELEHSQQLLKTQGIIWNAPSWDYRSKFHLILKFVGWFEQQRPDLFDEYLDDLGLHAGDGDDLSEDLEGEMEISITLKISECMNFVFTKKLSQKTSASLKNRNVQELENLGPEFIKVFENIGGLLTKQGKISIPQKKGPCTIQLNATQKRNNTLAELFELHRKSVERFHG